MVEPVTIHVELLDEGTQVWRPAHAEPIGPDVYLVLGSIPENELWAFPPG